MRTALLLLVLSLPSIPAAQPAAFALESPNPSTFGFFGDAVAAVPDADGDGINDFLISAFYENVDGITQAGRAYLYSGVTAALLYTFESPSPAEDGSFGRTLSGVPDADGDGLGDVLVGASGEPDGIFSDGRAHLFSGATGALLHTLESPNPESRGNFSGLEDGVAGVEDVDGDGRGDLLVGAPSETVEGEPGAGRVYLFSGTTGALLRTLVTPNPPNGTGSRFGFAVNGVADRDGDGYDDFLIGADQERVGGTNFVGRAYVFSGATGALIFTLVPPNPQRGLGFGWDVDEVPDADGDGVDDFAIGSSRLLGFAYLYSGATGTHLETWQSPAGMTSVRFGWSVSGVPDTDGDGLGEVLTSAPYENVGGLRNAGRAYLFRADDTLTLTAPTPRLDSEFGSDVEGLADVDGDGLGDFLIGADLEDTESVLDAGRAYLFLSGGAPTAVTPLDPSSPAALRVYPNPFSDATVLHFDLPQAADVTLEALDPLGRRVALPAEGRRAAGSHRVRWEAGALPGGVYLVRLTAGPSVQTQRVTRLR